MNSEYWKQYYRDNERRDPSDFARSVKGKELGTVLDVGAGDGRDTYPLSVYFNVYYVEPNNDLPFPGFKTLDEVSVPFDTMYARFFFHAVEEEVEDKALDLCADNKARLLAEFRIEPPEYFDHACRPIDPTEFVKKLVDRGYRSINLEIGNFSPDYDDPKLARIHAEY